MNEMEQSKQKPPCTECGKNIKVKRNGQTRGGRQKYYCTACKYSFFSDDWKREKPPLPKGIVPENVITTWLTNIRKVNTTAKIHGITRYMVMRVLFENAKFVEVNGALAIYLNDVLLNKVDKLRIEGMYLAEKRKQDARKAKTEQRKLKKLMTCDKETKETEGD